jgi:hypothetical protein
MVISARLVDTMTQRIPLASSRASFARHRVAPWSSRDSKAGTGLSIDIVPASLFARFVHFLFF